MMKVLLTDPIPSSLLQWIQAMLPGGVALDNVPTFNDEDFAQHAADADVLLSARRQIDARTLALAPRVRFIQQGGAGYDNIDVAAVVAAGIPVAYNPGVNAIAVVEHTLMLMLVLLKRFVPAEQGGSPLQSSRRRVSATLPAPPSAWWAWVTLAGPWLNVWCPSVRVCSTQRAIDRTMARRSASA